MAKNKKKKVYCMDCQYQKSSELFCQSITEDDYFAPDHRVDVSMRTQNYDNHCESFVPRQEKTK